MNSIRVKLYRTAAEWAVIEKIIPQKTIRSFLRSETKKIAEKYKDCPLCVTPAAGGEKIQRDCRLDPHIYSIFEEIATKMGKPIAAVIDDFIIVPLLIP